MHNPPVTEPMVPRYARGLIFRMIPLPVDSVRVMQILIVSYETIWQGCIFPITDTYFFYLSAWQIKLKAKYTERKPWAEIGMIGPRAAGESFAVPFDTSMQCEFRGCL